MIVLSIYSLAAKCRKL